MAASTNDTGSAAAGGDWTLEVATGAIETSLAADPYDSLLANAIPTVTLSAATTEALLGGQFTFTATFTNTEAAQPGFAPFIDLILPATGKDGAGAEIDDGITFVSATYLGQTVISYVTHLRCRRQRHPPAGQGHYRRSRSSSTRPPTARRPATSWSCCNCPSPACSGPAGDRRRYHLPVERPGRYQGLARPHPQGARRLPVRQRFRQQPGDRPFAVRGGIDILVVTPSGLKLTQSINMPEGETVTGPNFERSLTVTATPPPGQTLTNVDISQSLPNTIRVNSITPGAGGTIASLTLRNGSTITDPALISLALAQSPFLSSYTVRYASLTAPADTVVSFYVPDKDAAGNDVLDPVTGNDVPITLGQPTATGQWLPLDPRDQTVVDPGPPPVVAPADITATGNDATFVAKSVALLKSVAIASNAGSAGLSPGDELQYTLNVDLSDYFAIGKTLFNVGNLTITDQLGDGQRLVPARRC